jgi:uncharacterized RDD family membrane protein YckC
MHRTNLALAPQVQPTVRYEGPVGLERTRPSKPAPPIQGSLFFEKPAGKVIPFESFQTPSSGTASRPRAKAASGPRTASRTNSRRTGYVDDAQGKLDLLPSIPHKPRTLETTVEAVIFCDDPVATRMHRAIAAGFDWSMVLLAYGLFLVIYNLCGGKFLLDKSSLLLIGGVLPLLGCLYGFTWAVAGYETPGVRWANLRMTTFDGFRPERTQRLMRFAGSCLSLCTVVGVLWSLADEESLTWPDHISGTFPTPRQIDSQVFHRR